MMFDPHLKGGKGRGRGKEKEGKGMKEGGREGKEGKGENGWFDPPLLNTFRGP